MKEVIAQIGREYKNVLSREDNILDVFRFDSMDIIDFSPSHKLEDDEWFQINNFSRQNYFIEECSENFSTASLNQIDNSNYKKIQAICIIQDNQRFFQKITPSLFVNKKTILDYSGEPKIVECRKQIEIKDESDAIYANDTDTLYFKFISKIKTIFPGIEILHRDATQPEVDDFLGNNFIVLSNYQSNRVGSMNRKRIADIGMKYNTLGIEKQKKLIEYAKSKSEVKIENDQFVISSENDLKNVLYAMDQRYYYADIYEENRIANSVRIIN